MHKMLLEQEDDDTESGCVVSEAVKGTMRKLNVLAVVYATIDMVYVNACPISQVQIVLFIFPLFNKFKRYNKYHA